MFIKYAVSELTEFVPSKHEDPIQIKSVIKKKKKNYIIQTTNYEIKFITVI